MADVDLSRAAAAGSSGPTATGNRPGSGIGSKTEGDWPAQAADTIVNVVGSVRDRTAGPALTASRGVVYGTLAAVLATTALVLLCILVLRGAVLGIDGILDAADLGKEGRAVWIAYLLLGTGFSLGGWMLWRKAWAQPAR